MKTRDQYQELSSDTSGYFECQLSVLSETEKAVQFDASNSWLNSRNKGVWIPKSQMVILDMGLDCMGLDAGKRYFIKKWLYSKLK